VLTRKTIAERLAALLKMGWSFALAKRLGLDVENAVCI
jgi:hypothetical protein